MTVRAAAGGAAAGGPREMLPHRYPMLLVDRVTESIAAADGEGARLTAIKAITINEPWYVNLPDAPDEADYDYPEILVLESWCQAAGLLAVSGYDRLPADGAAGRVMLFGGVSQVSFSGRARPGDVLRHQVRQLRAFDATALFEGECLIGEQVLMTVSRLVIAPRPPADLRDQAGRAQEASRVGA